MISVCSIRQANFFFSSSSVGFSQAPYFFFYCILFSPSFVCAASTSFVLGATTMSLRLKLSFRPESILLETRDQVPVAARSDASFPGERGPPSSRKRKEKRRRRNNEETVRSRRRRRLLRSLLYSETK